MPWQLDPRAHHSSCEGERSGIGGRHADALGGGVGHHATVVTASSPAAGYPGFLLEVQHQVTS